MTSKTTDIFELSGRVAVITGGAGLLGVQHARAIAGAGGIPVLVDLSAERVHQKALELCEEYTIEATGIVADITDEAAVRALLAQVLDRFGRVDILINNAANNPAVETSSDVAFSRLENFPIDQWHADLSVGLTGAYLCCKIIGSEMARTKKGVIVNMASDLALIGPDQRLYRRPGLPEDRQPVKPVTYSVVKSALIGLTRYLATYWARDGVRVNAISPGGVFNAQPEEFLVKLNNLIPLGRMANADEYQGAILFLCSDASSYMTGANLVIEGGRTCW
jgi:NAD(P)-dependent dehydrogenase (short-subunit alcohol dehydrogenase family)